MASIHRHSSGRSPYWFASFIGPHGRWQLRSTKQKERRKALEIALEWEHAARKARDGILTEAQARRVLSDILEKTTGDTLRHVTTDDHIRTWLASKGSSKSPKTVARYENVMRLFKSQIGAKAGKPLTAVTPRDVQGFLDGRLKAGCSTKTVSVDRKTLSSCFGSAHRHGVILYNPVLATEIPKVVCSERDAFTPQQVAMLIAAAPDDEWRTAILFGYYLGARLSDCVRMTWESVDLSAGVIRYRQEKTDTQVEVPIHPQLERHLHKLAGTDRPDKYLCPTLKDRDSGGAHGLSQTFKAIMRSAGIDPGTAKGQGTRQFSRLSFHALRHSFTSHLANAGVSEEVRMRLTGHKTRDVHQKYTHQEFQTLRKAVAMLPSLGG